MSMTKKHFEAVASVIAQTAGEREDKDIDNAVQELRNFIVTALADEFEDFNPNFNRITFALACKANIKL